MRIVDREGEGDNGGDTTDNICINKLIHHIGNRPNLEYLFHFSNANQQYFRITDITC